MKVLICGAGRITRELLRQMGDRWDVTLIEKSEEQLHKTQALHPHYQNLVHGDASSRLVLEEAGLEKHEYVLALTNNDPVNLAVCQAARKKRVAHVLARVNDQGALDGFSKIQVKTLRVNFQAATMINQFLQDPMLTATPLSLGQGEILEVDISSRSRFVGQTCSVLSEGDWRLAAIHRRDELFFPERNTVIEAGDRLVIVAQTRSFWDISELLHSGHLEFPLAYGQEILLSTGACKNDDLVPLMDESVSLLRNSKARTATVIMSGDHHPDSAQLPDLTQGIEVRLEIAEDEQWDEIYDACSERSIGLVVIPPLSSGSLRALIKPKLITLAHSLPCPLLISRNTHPYQRILVPFNATSRAERAVEVAIDLARQQNGQVSVAVVEQSEFIHGDQEKDWVDTVFSRVRELAHIHKTQLVEVVRKGNPVKELVELAQDFDLMVVGSTTRGAGLFSPHVGELLVTRSCCSTLIITA